MNSIKMNSKREKNFSSKPLSGSAIIFAAIQQQYKLINSKKV